MAGASAGAGVLEKKPRGVLFVCVGLVTDSTPLCQATLILAPSSHGSCQKRSLDRMQCSARNNHIWLVWLRAKLCKAICENKLLHGDSAQIAKQEDRK